jgi:DNA (cytosine-5)-methyltransferase 1
MGLIVDNFAGGGGASLGIEWALGRSPDIAVNHNPQAVAMHAANHPATRHLCGDVWDVKPRQVCAGRTVDLAWFSPDCTFHSKARGGKPFRDRNKARRRRGLAHVVISWAREVSPTVIALENVEEFKNWGPLDEDGNPIPEKAGLSFRQWLGYLRAAGYAFEMRELRACDYGAPTTRKRLFLVARCDGLPIVWPEATHGPCRRPFVSAAECIDWSIPAPSIFGRPKPLVEASLRRVARGVRRFILDEPKPFIVGDVAGTMIHLGNGERAGQSPRVYDVREPMRTIVAGGVKLTVVYAFLAKHYGGNYNGAGIDARSPFSTITTIDHHALVTASNTGDRSAEVADLLRRFSESDVGAKRIADLGMRRLVPRELFRGQGFPDSYVIAPLVDGKPLSATAQVGMVGNSVSPHVAAAIVAANCARSQAVAA